MSMSKFLPSCRRWSSQQIPLRTLTTCRPQLAYAKPAQPAAKAASPASPAPSTSAAPRAPSANPLQSSHAQGGSSSSPQPASESSVPDTNATDWSSSFSGLGSQPFEARIADLLLAPIDPLDVEIKPDGIIFLPEIKYRRTLNRAFGPGGWGLAPRGPEKIEGKTVSREYALVCMGQLVAIARGENDFFDPSGVATATEGCKSNALMRCCKDLGVASELWDPKFIRDFKSKHAIAVFASNTTNNQKKRMWRRKDDPPFGYPWKEG